jgi:penicillin amidase
MEASERGAGDVARGPWGDVRVRRDAWGTPQVDVRHDREAAWVTGYLHATDRLVQAQLQVAVGEGRLMQLLGDVPFARRCDRATRQLGFAVGLDAAVRDMDEPLKAWMSAYCAGFRQGARERGTPTLLRVLGWRVRPWGPREVLLVHRVLSWFGLTSLTQLAKASLGELLARGATRGLVEAMLGDGASGLDLDALRGVDWPGEDALLGLAVPGGSNAFAIHGSRTERGAALVMAEFHLEVGRLPPALYAIDLRGPGGATPLGMTVPGVPHVVAGRNAAVAWAYTFGHADNVDLTVERVEGDDAEVAVRVGTRLERPRLREEAVSVRGQPEERWRFWDLPGGRALLGEPRAGHAVAALAWRGLEDPVADHAVLFAARGARSVDEIMTLHRGVRCLTTGACFGDADGHIGWLHTGRVAAARAGWGPRARGEDDADVPESERPAAFDPPEGFVAAANEAIPGWTSFSEPPYRRQRLASLLAAEGVWDEARAWEVSYDEVDLCATRLLPVWARVAPGLGALSSWAAWALRQEGDRSPEGRHTRLSFHGLHHVVSRALLVRLGGETLAAGLLDRLGLLLAVQDPLDRLLALERPDLLDAAGLRALLEEAWPRRLPPGEGPTVDRAPFKNQVLDTPVSGVVGWHTAPLSWPGGPTSLFQSRRVPLFDQAVLGGPAFHLLMDLAVPGGRYNVAGGASERIRGPGYGAGLDAWRDGGWLPLGRPGEGGPVRWRGGGARERGAG